MADNAMQYMDPSTSRLVFAIHRPSLTLVLLPFIQGLSTSLALESVYLSAPASPSTFLTFLSNTDSH